jgi:hypothetical protein
MAMDTTLPTTMATVSHVAMNAIQPIHVVINSLPTDYTGLIISVVAAGATLLAAAAAWRSAKASMRSASASERAVNQQQQDSALARNEADRQIENLAAQIRIMQDQSRAAIEHAASAKLQSEADAVRWSTQAHIDLSVLMKEGKYDIAYVNCWSVALAEFLLFRANTLPREIFRLSVIKHVQFGGKFSWWRGQIFSELAMLNPSVNNDFIEFIKSWEKVDTKVQEFRKDWVGKHGHSTSNDAINAALAGLVNYMFDGMFPPPAPPTNNPN